MDNLSTILLYFFTSLIIATTALYVYIKYYLFNYWRKHNVPFPVPKVPFGNIENLVKGKQGFGEIALCVYKEFKKYHHKHGGFYFFAFPMYMPLDPEIIKHILIKDFPNFVSRGVYYDEHNEPLTAHLFAIDGNKWKNLRAKLSPTFTSGKIKMMFPILLACGENLKFIFDNAVENNEEVDIKDVMARFTTDIIGSCAFGLECNSLKNPDAEFRRMGRKIFELSVWEATKFSFGFISPALVKFLHLRIFNKEASDFFFRVTKDMIDYREKNNVERPDFLQLLMQLKNQGQLDKTATPVNITFNEIAAQAFVFFVAGFETSSTTMTFIFLELALNRDIQDKLREEICAVLKEHNGQITYEGVMKMVYLEKVILETLRKYPPITQLNRQCEIENYKVPNTKLKLEKNTRIVISVFGLHMDPDYYPNPELFDPERFSEENKSKRHPCVYLPFGEGPRNCIGLRFGMLQTKIGVIILISRYMISLNKKTKLPITYDPKSIVLTPKEKIWLNLKKI